MFTHTFFKECVSLLWDDALLSYSAIYDRQLIMHPGMLCLFPIGYVHGCRLESVGLCFVIQVQSHSALGDRLMRTSPLSVMPVTDPSNKDHTVFLSCHMGTWLSVSAAALSDLF